MGNDPQIHRPNWKKASCKTCGPSGEQPSWAPWIVVGLFMAAMGAVWASQRIAERGTRIVSSSCAWDAEQGAYVARYVARNAEDRYKLVELAVQGRFKPVPGTRWPSESLKYRYEAITQNSAILLDPKSEATGEQRFAIPGAPDLLCEARMTVSRQERFDQRPSEDLVRAMVH